MADQTTSSSAKPEQLEGIVQPHANDVLSGRGNFVNHHTGNENFRALWVIIWSAHLSLFGGCGGDRRRAASGSWIELFQYCISVSS